MYTYMYTYSTCTVHVVYVIYHFVSFTFSNRQQNHFRRITNWNREANTTGKKLPIHTMYTELHCTYTVHVQYIAFAAIVSACIVLWVEFILTCTCMWCVIIVFSWSRENRSSLEIFSYSNGKSTCIVRSTLYVAFTNAALLELDHQVYFKSLFLSNDTVVEKTEMRHTYMYIVNSKTVVSHWHHWTCCFSCTPVAGIASPITCKSLHWSLCNDYYLYRNTSLPLVTIWSAYQRVCVVVTHSRNCCSIIITSSLSQRLYTSWKYR